ncbi:hypothetical protein Acsp07_55770 [Actinomycetospora sp. NBRC 106378]|nr:hypothetical protein Acsp07_55770 [Actinomycetospora sp. NBRC 106378]
MPERGPDDAARINAESVDGSRSDRLRSRRPQQPPSQAESSSARAVGAPTSLAGNASRIGWASTTGHRPPRARSVAEDAAARPVPTVGVLTSGRAYPEHAEASSTGVHAGPPRQNCHTGRSTAWDGAPAMTGPDDSSHGARRHGGPFPPTAVLPRGGVA